MNGKGSKRRPMLVDNTTFTNNWELIFNKKFGEPKYCTHFDCGYCVEKLVGGMYQECDGYLNCPLFEEKQKCQ